MSEYQYYEFQALDRTLNEKEMGELRKVSSRGHITSSSYVNEYNYGDFKGNINEWMERYFDVFFYFSDSGTKILELKIAEGLLSLKTAELYCNGEYCSAYSKNGD